MTSIPLNQPLAADLSADHVPLSAPTKQSPHILIIGGGVIGLTTAWFALDRGYRVTVISKEWASYGQGPRLASQIAGALWELPPAGCGPQAVQGKLHTCQRWALESLKIYRAMADSDLGKAFGVKMRLFTSFHTNRISDDQLKSKKMELIRTEQLEDFEKGTHLFQKYGVNPDSHGGLHDAYEHQAPIIDTDVAMAFLMELIRSKGATLHTANIQGDILDQEGYLLETYGADAIVNATGVMAREAATDNAVYCLRGGLLRLINDGTHFPKVNNAMLVSSETKFDGDFHDMAFIVPRNDNTLLLGSILHQDTWELNLTSDCPEILEMRGRCEDLFPALKNAKVDPVFPLAQGRRPMRRSHVRVEREERRMSRIVHSYGHGGAGWSLAFGSARETVRLVEKVLSEKAFSTGEIPKQLCKY
ncbi:hypothetical protein PENPOL_c026G07342 [Penicillium polonicum]|uniref:FAD dependent oxidoreductase domain-containing protein n=1 Tax=Penicillium polonicum TaxID=60169 RepID=A0A1V6N6B7_PENPO|nr:hypothetical protein PENPOL_c026G07342 [Penicillium polonicum]